MRERVKRWINAALRPAGVQLVASSQDDRLALVRLLERLCVHHIIDVGANKGQFARQLLDKGFAGHIHCCEPQSGPYDHLRKQFSGHKQVEILPRCAIGDRDGKAVIQIAGNSVSSSLRPMLEAHENAAPHSVIVGQEEVTLKRVDTLFANRPEIFAEGALLKIDTQGFEAEVLRGAAESLPKCRAVLIEMSTVPLYDGQALWDQLHGQLTKADFELWDLMPDFRDRNSGQLLQFDGLYLHRDHRPALTGSFG